MNWSSGEISQLRTDEDSLDWTQRHRRSSISYKQSINHVFVQTVTQKFTLFKSKLMHLYPRITIWCLNKKMKKQREKKTWKFFTFDNWIVSRTEITISHHVTILQSQFINKKHVCLQKAVRKNQYFMAYLEYAGSVRCPPCIQEVIFACAHEPFTYRTKHTQTSTDKVSGEVRYGEGWEEALLL